MLCERQHVQFTRAPLNLSLNLAIQFFDEIQLIAINDVSNAPRQNYRRTRDWANITPENKQGVLKRNLRGNLVDICRI